MSATQDSIQAVDFRYILLDDYKKLGISEEELSVIMMVDHLLRRGNDLVTADLLSLKMNYKTAAIDAILVSLVKKGLLEYEVSPDKPGMRTSLEPLKKKLYKQFELDLAKDRANLLSAERAETLNRLYAYFEKRMNRTLSPIELDTISSWLDDNYGETAIKDALEDALSAGKRTMKSIDKILRSGRAREDVAKEGYTAVNDKWSKDIEKTIEIAKTKWVDDDDKK
ncbi:MAG: DNA replication protein DnaD [Tenericutes bacterium ADurb.BinA155]|jgi:DNA replication protein|nr:MAG: DNA replication protein DnaD [Tenericutes bacterium ADurb.BinA155]